MACSFSSQPSPCCLGPLLRLLLLFCAVEMSFELAVVVEFFKVSGRLCCFLIFLESDADAEEEDVKEDVEEEVEEDLEHLPS